MRVQFNFVFFDEKLIAIVLHANPRARAHFYRYTTTHSCRNTCEMDAREFYYSRIVCQTPLCSACRASRFSSTATWIIIIIVVSRVCTYLLFIQYPILFIYIYRHRQLDEGWNIILYSRSERTRGWGFILPNHDVITYINIYIYNARVYAYYIISV